MSDTSPALDSPLEQAVEQLHELAQLHQSDAPAEASSLNRICAHIVNIKRSVLASSEDHANAAKRLADFSLTLARMADGALASDQANAARLKELAATLNTAGKELASGDAASKWAFSEKVSH